MSEADTLLRAFETGELDPAGFDHRKHVQVGYEMLKRYPFMEASQRFARALSSLAASAGAPEKFNVTITLAFLALIAERMADHGEENFACFIAANEDLLSSRALDAWYSSERLSSPLARTQFLLPEAVPTTTGPAHSAK